MLIGKLQHFLLEMGKGFSFVARQKRISFDNQHFYIDLVFYNYLARCFVLIDLKADIALFIRAAFRESTGSDYAPTLTWPQSRFSFSRLVEELHEQFPSIESMKFGNDDIISALAIPRLQSLEVAFA